MGHLVNNKDEVYLLLAERLNRNPVGAPINETLMEILHRLYTESEAIVGSKFPMVPIALGKIAKLTGIEEQQLKIILDGMAEKGLVLDIPRKDSFYYMLVPMVVGFFEYTFMRVQDHVKLKDLAELFQAYFNHPEVREEFAGKDTKMMRTLVYEKVIPVAVETEVLTYERASEIIKQSGGGAISVCPCRHEAVHLGKSCGAPLEVCTSLGSAAEWIIRKGLGKPATVDELLRVLDETERIGLVHNCDNVLNKPAYICHCCGCCCVILTGINKNSQYATMPSNFIPTLEQETCTGCGTCAERCQIMAISLQADSCGLELPMVHKEACLGCGVCASACPSNALTMIRRADIYVPPSNAQEKFSRMAGEKGRL